MKKIGKNLDVQFSHIYPQSLFHRLTDLSCIFISSSIQASKCCGGNIVLCDLILKIFFSITHVTREQNWPLICFYQILYYRRLNISIAGLTVGNAEGRRLFARIKNSVELNLVCKHATETQLVKTRFIQRNLFIIFCKEWIEISKSVIVSPIGIKATVKDASRKIERKFERKLEL